MNTQELEVSELSEYLRKSALRPVEQGVFLVFWLLAHGGGRRLREGRVVDAALVVLQMAGFHYRDVDQWVNLAARLGFNDRQLAAIEVGLTLSVLRETDDDDFRGPALDSYTRIQVKRLRDHACGFVSWAQIADERKKAKEVQRQRALQAFRDVDRLFGIHLSNTEEGGDKNVG